MARFFGGFDLLEPGLVRPDLWRPELDEARCPGPEVSCRGPRRTCRRGPAGQGKETRLDGTVEVPAGTVDAPVLLMTCS
ncbi:hypothetical protein [Streptomyces halstedii]|uniref:hypothetical protein n=1 Tax=Streptomyces halstedii TaxID=1944 RepID=UPI0034245184